MIWVRKGVGQGITDDHLMKWSAIIFKLSTVLLVATFPMVMTCSAEAARPARTGLNDPAVATDSMPSYATRYYQIYTDLPRDDVREAAIRMTKMAEEYHDRTAGFSGSINQRLPFYLFRSANDYYAAGGIPGSAGVFTGSKLMAIAGEHVGAGTWHIIQHEGFHQFAAYVIRGNLPAWVNEGLAEYFGESIFTGDGFVTGVVPPERLSRLKDEMKGGRLKSIKDLMLLSHAQWNGEMSLANYDQAWSLVYFLAHGDGGKYQPAFVAFMKDIARGVPYAKAWLDRFGPADPLEARWKAYFTQLPPDTSADLIAQARVAVLTSFLARATAQKQRFESFTAFHEAAKSGGLKISDADWLPQTLLEDTLRRLDPEAQWSLGADPQRSPEVVCASSDGVDFTGRFTLSGDQVKRVWVEIDDLGKTVTLARKLVAEDKKPEARTILRNALRDHPRSRAAAEARKLMGEIR